MAKCRVSPQGDPNFLDSEIHLQPQKKLALEKHAVRIDAPKICHHAEAGYGDLNLTQFFLRKLPGYCFSLLNIDGLPHLKSLYEWPTRPDFFNQLKECPIEEATYLELQSMGTRLGLRNPYGLLIFYLTCDILGLQNLLFLSHLFVFKEFGLNILR